MSAAMWIGTLALVATAALTVALVRTRARLTRVERSARLLEAIVHDELAPGLVEARAEARSATASARDAVVATGGQVAPARLPFEQVTGPVVRAVAFGASARRAIARVAGSPRVARRDVRRSA